MLQRSSAMARWVGWRLRVLVVLALAGSVGLFAMVRLLAGTHAIDARWEAFGPDRVALAASEDPALQAMLGRRLVAITPADGQPIAADATLLQRSPRWIVADAERQRLLVTQDRVGRALAQPGLSLTFDDSSPVQVRPRTRGLAGLGGAFWALCALALVLYLIGIVVALATPGKANVLYAVVVVSQSINLSMVAAESMQGFGVPPGFGRIDLALRTLCDLVSAAAVLQACLFHPAVLPGTRWVGVLAWGTALGFSAGAALTGWVNQWWATQALALLYGLGCMLVLAWSYRIDPNPFAIVLRRLSVIATGTLLLLTVAVALVSREALAHHTVATVGSMIWYVFFASLLLLIPFMSRSQHVMREFAVLAGISTVATSLDLLFVAVFSLGQFASLTLALVVSLGLYAGARHWLVDRILGGSAVSAERMFESLYRAAREIEAAPRKTAAQLTKLLRELFEPLEIVHAVHRTSRSRVAPDGSTLIVPIPRLPGADEDEPPPGTILLRYARHGRRLFSVDDARLTDRVIEQLRRAVAYDRAVEHGRSQERTRIAQDLHDDIGARLLTLMYKAQTPEMEEYVRHTLQDLKTLTRGLAASSHHLSHAAAEWKADITQRLQASQCELDWSFDLDRDIPLTVVQWSGITRVLRELVNNIIAHAQARQVRIACAFEAGRLSISVADDGVGRSPQAWSHGLGLGGVRKRVKLLGGDIRWRERNARGIACEFRVPLLGGRR